MSKKDFVHLHVHTEYSILDGLIKIEPLVERIKALGMSACAITDHGTLAGALKFYKVCRAMNIKPILGCEAYITQDPDDLPNEEKHRDNRHCVLIAQNLQGWQRLVWLLNRATLHNFYYKPRIWIGHLEQDCRNLIATSACIGGIVAKKQSSDGTIPGAHYIEDEHRFVDSEGVGISFLRQFKELFGENFYLEVQDHPMWEQIAFNQWAIPTAQIENVPLVLTCDAHFLREEDKQTHKLIMAQQIKQTTDSAEYGYEYGKLFIREPEELYKFTEKLHIQEAFWNTRTIAEQCDIQLTLGQYESPDFNITECPDYGEFSGNISTI